MKSQDIFLLLKLLSLEKRSAAVPDEVYTASWLASSYSVRGLAASAGISKSEVSAALNRWPLAGT